MSRYRAAVLKGSDYRTERWSGGETTELSIGPDSASYRSREFLWRISSAKVELEQSTFTRLPDYNRVIMSLKGELQLSHDGGKWLSLKEYEPHFFDGGAATESRGLVTDFNLMMRKGICTGLVRGLKIGSLGQAGEGLDSLEEFWQAVGQEPADALLFYCAEGRAEAEFGQARTELQAGEALRLDWTGNPSEAVKDWGEILTLSGEALFAAAAVRCRGDAAGKEI